MYTLWLLRIRQNREATLAGLPFPVQLAFDGMSFEI
jgi:hypothetical protein